MDGIIMSADSCDPYAPKSLRSSMGTLLRLPIFVVEDVIPFIKKWKYDISFLNFAKYLIVSTQSKIPINAVITIKILKSILFYFLGK